MVTVPPPESLLPSRCGNMALWYAPLLCTWTWCILDEGVQQKGWVSEDTQGMNTWEEPGAARGNSFHPAMTSDCRPWLLDTIPPTSLRKARKISTVLKNWPSPLLLRVSKKNLTAAFILIWNVPARETRQRLHTRSLLSYGFMLSMSLHLPQM